MAEPAGIINRYGPKDDRAFPANRRRYCTEIQELAHAVRNLVYDVLPQTIEVIWPKQGSVGWGRDRKLANSSPT